MENRLIGIITVIIASLLYYFAYQKNNQNKETQTIILILLGGLILRIFTSCDMFLHVWDERYHALVAKNLIENPIVPMLYVNPIVDYDYRIWSMNHVWLHKQPFPLYSMAFSMFLFGKNVIALRLPSILLSTSMIFSTYKIGEYLSNKKVGILAAFLCSINGLLIEQTAGRVTTDHIDVFFFSLISWAVFFLLKSTKDRSILYLILGGIITGLAILSKWLPALIVFPIWILYSFHKLTIKELIFRVFIALFVTILVAAPWQWYILTYYPNEANWEYAYNTRHLYESLEAHKHPIYFHFSMMRIIFGELVYLPILWLIYSAIKEIRKAAYTKLTLLAWILIPYMFFTLVATKLQGYILFCAPAIFIGISLFYYHLKNQKTSLKWLQKIVLLLLIILPIRYSIERIKPFDNMERTADWITEIKAFETKQKGIKTVILNSKYPIETMFHTDIIAYEWMPSLSNIHRLDSLGYSIYIDNHLPVDSNIYQLDFIKRMYITGDKSQNTKE